MTTKPFLLIEGVRIKWDYAPLGSEEVLQPVLYPVVAEPTSSLGQITTHNPTPVRVPLLPLMQEMRSAMYKEKNIVFSYYVTKEPKTLAECREQLVAMTFGAPKVDWWHSYSDLTGYLWTNIDFSVEGHDVEAEIRGQVSSLGGEAYLTLELRAM